MILQHGGLKRSSLEFEVAEAWNRKESLFNVANMYTERKMVIRYWKKFHAMVGLRNKLPNNYIYGVMVNTEHASPEWLSHHGYVGVGKKLREIIKNT